MHPQTLRMYEARGLIEPQRSPKGTRLYSQDDVERLRRIQEMTAELGLNLAGVERVLDLEHEIEQMHARMEELEVAGAAGPGRAGRGARARAPLVPRRARAVRPRGSLELVRAADARSPFPDLRPRENKTARRQQMQPDRFTIKSQEALAARRAPGAGGAQPAGRAPRTCCACCSATARPSPSTLRAGSFPACSRSSASTSKLCAEQLDGELGRLPKFSDGVPSEGDAALRRS